MQLLDGQVIPWAKYLAALAAEKTPADIQEAKRMENMGPRNLNEQTPQYRKYTNAINEEINRYEQTLRDINESGRSGEWQHRARGEARGRVVDAVNTWRDRAYKQLERDADAIKPIPPKDATMRLWSRIAHDSDAKHLNDASEVLEWYERTAPGLDYEARTQLDAAAKNRLVELDAKAFVTDLQARAMRFYTDEERKIANDSFAVHRHGEVLSAVSGWAQKFIDEANEIASRTDARNQVPKRRLSLPMVFEEMLTAGLST